MNFCMYAIYVYAIEYVFNNVEPVEPFRVSLYNYHLTRVWGIVHFNLMPIFSWKKHSGALRHEAKCIVDHFHLPKYPGMAQSGCLRYTDAQLQGCQICKAI